MNSLEDDRKEAMAAFAALLIRQAREQGKTYEQIGELIGRDKAHVKQIASGASGVGQSVWLAIADWQRKAPGELWDEALDWWKSAGRALHAAELKKKANEATMRVQRSASPPPSSESGIRAQTRAGGKKKRPKIVGH